MNVSNIHTLLRERLTRLFFCIHSNDDPDRICSVIHMLRDVFDVLQRTNTQQPLHYYEQILYKMTCYSRDIKKGKGVRTMVYAMIYEWHKYNKIKCFDLIDSLVFSKITSITENDYVCDSPYGCWRDLKEISRWTYEKTQDSKHPIVLYCIYLLNYQLYLDVNQLDTRNCSNVAKWIPRERGKWQWFFNELAFHWAFVYTPYLCIDDPRAKNKMAMNYRKICSMLNLHNGTLEIDLCLKTRRISIDSIGRKSAFKYGRIWSNADVKHRLLQPTYPYKMQGLCGFHYYPGDFVSEAMKDRDSQTLISLWNRTIRQLRFLYSTYTVLPILDTSMFFMNHSSVYHSAIGIALSIAEISTFGKRILAMGHNPAWIRIPDDYTFMDSVYFLQKCLSDLANANLERTIGLLIQSFLLSNMTEEDIEHVCLVILSDMQFDNGDTAEEDESIHEKIKRQFRKSGIVRMPHIVYWGLGDVSRMPCGFDESRTTLISDTSSSGFEFFRYLNFQFGRELTPYLSMCRVLGQKRYFMEDFSL